jgi:hypothetical protein
MSDPRPGHIRVSDTLTGRSCLSSPVDHSVQLTNTLRHFLELQTSLPQAPFKSKLPRRDLSLTLE